jgi:hypothetical protein
VDGGVSSWGGRGGFGETSLQAVIITNDNRKNNIE